MIAIIVKEETPIGNHTGAIHGLGIKKSTSMVLKLGGHLIKI